VTTCIAVIHACAGEVREGRIAERDAVRILSTTVRDLFTGGGAPDESAAPDGSQVPGRGQVPGGNA